MPCPVELRMAIPGNHRLSLPPATAGPDYRFRCRDVTRANNDHKSKGLTAFQSNVDFVPAQTRDDSRAGRARIPVFPLRYFSATALPQYLEPTLRQNPRPEG